MKPKILRITGITIALFILAGIVGFESCQKNNDHKNLANNISSSMASKPFLVRILTVQLRRTRGETRHLPHVSCNCVNCFGLCSPTPGYIDDVLSANDPFNLGLHEIAGNKATLYFFEQPDTAEVNIDPTFYVDDIMTTRYNGVDSTIILPGTYAYDNTPGTVNVQGKDFSYYGTTQVDVIH